MDNLQDRKPRGSFAPAFHNALSYSGALIALPLAAWWLTGTVHWLPLVLWAFHFARRTAESLWVHRYSGRPVPPSDWAVEYLYYWGFGAWIGATLSVEAAEPLRWLGVLVFALGEVGNAWSHQKLRALRSARGDSSRALPRGGLFEWVACPHYLFEITSWLGFALVVNQLAAWCFFALGACILTVYARERQKKYRSEFDGKNAPLYPPRRKALVPFVF